MAQAEKLDMGGPIADAAQASDAKKTPKGPLARAAAQRPAEPLQEAEESDTDFGVRWARVEETVEVPKAGGKYVMQKGKVVSSKGYDFEELERAGVKLTACDEPAWHRHLRETGRSLAK